MSLELTRSGDSSSYDDLQLLRRIGIACVSQDLRAVERDVDTHAGLHQVSRVRCNEPG